MKKDSKEVPKRISVDEHIKLNPKSIYRDNRSRLFTAIFREKEDMLSLYNAINGTSYDNPDDVIVTELEDAIYLGLKGDLSFIVDFRLNIYEHQSTINPNMPLRDLFYFSAQMRGLIELPKMYGSKLVKIPTPQFVVFYNGVRTVEERQIICLSNAFERKTNEPALELKVLVLNINQGYNMNLMSACKKLNDYTIYVAKIRKYVKMNIKLEDAINKAIDECIDENVLREYLLKHRNEVYEMSMFECTDEEIIDAIKESEYDLGHEAGKVEGIEEGHEIGLKEGIEEGQIMTLVKLVQTGIITDEQAANNLSISKEEFEKILNEKIARNISE